VLNKAITNIHPHPPSFGEIKIKKRTNTLDAPREPEGGKTN
jgi:hypothetical protein